jgi:hypothetical protein
MTAWCGVFALALNYAPASAQILDIPHPGGLTELFVNNNALVIQPASSPANYWVTPAGRFLLATGATAPVGGDPTRSGDEGVNFVSEPIGDAQFGAPNTVTGFDSAIQFSVDQTSTVSGVTPELFDIWNAMNAVAPNTNPIALPNFWLVPMTANSRGATGTGLIPLNGTNNPAEASLQAYHNFELVGDALMIEIIVTNPTLATHNVGLHLAFHTSFGGPTTDGAPIILSNGTTVENERVLPDLGPGGGSLPTNWVSYDNPDNPLISVRGTLNTPEILRAGTANASAGAPNAVEFGLWPHVVGSGMGFVPNPAISLIGEDWGVGVKWNEQPLAAGASIRYVTYIGFGASQPNYEPTFATLGYAPVKLISHAGDDPSTPAVEKFYLTDGENRSPFPVAVYVDNFGNSALQNASATITLPVGSGLILFPATQATTVNLGAVPRNALANATWMLNADQARPGLVTLGLAGPSGRDVSRQMQIPSIPVLVPRTSTNGLDMISIPYTFNNTDADYVLSSLGGLNPGQNGSLIRWDPTSLVYRWFPNPFVTNITPGDGYWLLDKNGTTIELPADATALPTNLNVNVPLVQGWNQIGNPFTLPVNFTDLQVTTALDGTLSMTDAVSRGLVQPALFSYVPTAGTYTWATDITQTQMTPYLGYWILVHQDMTLIVPPPGLVATAGVRAQTVSSQQGWRATVLLSGPGLNAPRTFGEDPNAKDGTDNFDLVAPPAALAVTADAAFVTPTGQGAPLVADIRAQDKTAKTWYLQVSCSQPRQGLALSWPDLSALPNDMVPVLEDVATGTSCFMRSTARYNFDMTAAGTRLFTITVQPTAGLGPMVSGVQAQETTGGTFAITYALSAPCTVDVQIRNLAGVLIRQLSSGAVMAAGNNSILWDGRGQSGSRVPAGRYLCSLAARAPDTGQASNVITTFEVSR